MFSWDTQKAIANYEKHGVPFEEESTVFGDPDALDWEDLAHSHNEPRFKRLGKAITGRILLVVYTVRRSETWQRNSPHHQREAEQPQRTPSICPTMTSTSPTFPSLRMK